ncbi:hypothetical protein MPUL_32580 [Mycolicibacterium pulveris]|uniref:Uncharacterized protein n=1 Tax=Mycolicibacterium pulveris TaxID=36813 RepID=A0A7I7UM77_MYCPV|nr:hypothetical protein MPUL_32580 [Mycolicibacterium pulveris]
MPEIELTNVAPAGVEQWPTGVGLGVQYHDGPPGPNGTANTFVVTDRIIGGRAIEPTGHSIEGRASVDYGHRPEQHVVEVTSCTQPSGWSQSADGW